MRYCTRCVQPDTRPGVYFSEDGVCGACLWEDEKKAIDWEERERELEKICEWARSHTKNAYNCVIGVSGGKDSTFQALYARERLGLRPLLVSSEPNFNTPLGKANLENLKSLGFDCISLRANPRLMKKLVKHDFYEILNISRPSEYPLYASACIIADRFDVPLIIQGENAGQTLGASKDTGTGGDAFMQFKLNTIKADPFAAYAKDGISPADLFLFQPNLEKLLAKGVRSIFLSYYAKEWSQPHNARFAIAHGLEIMPPDTDPYEQGMYRRFLGLDYYFRPLNQLLKYIKLGFGMTTDLACYDLRDGLLSYDEAVFLVRELDGKCGESLIQDFCRYLDISAEHFWSHVNTFRGSMWSSDKQGNWHLEKPIWEQYSVAEGHSVQKIMQRLGM